MNKQQQPQQISFDVRQAETMVCPKCNCPVWDTKTVLKRVSAIIAGTEQIAQVPVLVCANCGTCAPGTEAIIGEVKAPEGVPSTILTK
jgi:hypothetical protein